MTPVHHSDNLIAVLNAIREFVSNFFKEILHKIRYALQAPSNTNPPSKKYKLSLADLVSLALFRFFTGHDNWKAFYKHIKTYHLKDFAKIPCYKNFLRAMNRLSVFALLLLTGLMNFFKSLTKLKSPKLADGSKLEVCKIKREFTHKVCKRIARKSKSSLGWFYGFKLHLICNELMQILNFRITTGNTDEREGLEMMWQDIFGLIIADAGYVSKRLGEKAFTLGKRLLTGVRANMKRIMTKAQHTLLKLRQKIETVLSVLKSRLGMETTLPRSELGYFAHYLWCLASYQLRKYFELLCSKPFLT